MPPSAPVPSSPDGPPTVSPSFSANLASLCPLMNHQNHNQRRPVIPTAPVRSDTLAWVTPSLSPISLRHTVRIHPTTDSSNDTLCSHSGDHRPLSIYDFHPFLLQHIASGTQGSTSPSSRSRISSPCLCGRPLAVSKSQTICRVIMVYSPITMQQFILSSANAAVYFPTSLHHFLTGSRSRKIVASQ
jgi:hypothetical protein